MTVLSQDVQSALLAAAASDDSSSEDAHESHSHSVVRTVYSFDSVGSIAAHTGLNALLSFTGELLFAPSAVYLNGTRQEFTDDKLTGSEYYVDEGMLYSSYTINHGERILLEVLTIVLAFLENTIHLQTAPPLPEKGTSRKSTKPLKRESRM